MASAEEGSGEKGGISQKQRTTQGLGVQRFCRRDRACRDPGGYNCTCDTTFLRVTERGVPSDHAMPRRRAQHLDHILREWAYDPETVSVRLVPGGDGRGHLKMRVDLGALQLEPPGGRRR